MSTELQGRLQRLRNPLPALAPVTAEEFNECAYDSRADIPLCEDERATWVIAFGHVDKDLFVAAVNRYDDELASILTDTPPYKADRVWHGYAVTVKTGPEWSLRLARRPDPEELKFAITGIFR